MPSPLSLFALALSTGLLLRPALASEEVIAPSAPVLAAVEVVDRATGEVLPTYHHRGETWVAGIPGHNYAVRVYNASAGRILGVVAVDGVNAVSGDTAAWSQTGYVLGAGENFDVLGWRKSNERVADFVFTDLEDSYAARTGRAADVGVIGVAFFREKPLAPVSVLGMDSSARRSAGARSLGAGGGAHAPAPAPSAAPPAADSLGEVGSLAAASNSPLGTGHGASEISRVGSTRFERARPLPDLVVTIRYDRPETLLALGVMPAPRRIAPAPRPFPDSAAGGFVPDPPRR